MEKMSLEFASMLRVSIKFLYEISQETLEKMQERIDLANTNWETEGDPDMLTKKIGDSFPFKQ